ncbi:MAG: hypothetical protein ACOY3Y_08520 [Acidobacteriota bacterium]
MSSPSSFWNRVPAVWKVLTLIAAFIGAGAAAHAYFERYVTKDEMSKHTADEVGLREQIRQLREADAKRAADIAAIKELAADTRDDVKRLLQHMLRYPPPRRGGR